MADIWRGTARFKRRTEIAQAIIRRMIIGVTLQRRLAKDSHIEKQERNSQQRTSIERWENEGGTSDA